MPVRSGQRGLDRLGQQFTSGVGRPSDADSFSHFSMMSGPASPAPDNHAAAHPASSASPQQSPAPRAALKQSALISDSDRQTHAAPYIPGADAVRVGSLGDIITAHPPKPADRDRAHPERG